MWQTFTFSLVSNSMPFEASDQLSPHWNYFIALEEDLDRASRYVEFTEANFQTFSIEFAHLMFAAASEVEVILKRFCKRYAPRKNPKNIDDYKKIVLGGDDGDDFRLKSLAKQRVLIPRYGLTLYPWESWLENSHPKWWRDYNRVKHSRHEAFADANLHNALSAVGGLFVLSLELAARPETIEGRMELPSILLTRIQPQPRLFYLPHGSAQDKW